MAARKPSKASAARPATTGGPRKRIEFDPETLQALELLARDSMKDLQELADEAFRDLLKKHRRPTSLKEALRQSTRRLAANDQPAKTSTKVREPTKIAVRSMPPRLRHR